MLITLRKNVNNFLKVYCEIEILDTKQLKVV